MEQSSGKVVRWSDWDAAGLEHLSLARTGTGTVVDSLVIGVHEGLPYGLHYRLKLDPQWRVRELLAERAGGTGLHILSDGKGSWTEAGGGALPRLDGCIDVDIAATPFTNSLPIRRLALQQGQAQEIRVAYVPLPDLDPRAAEQRYTRLGNRRYLYEAIASGFAAELEVDEEGIVYDYPDLFRRLPV
ncbi:putative glycolipid-binding domain-containing protein [Actibacterium sp. MT2.3-13A]|uniref:putative glycolipid-binding domain-containing protein n=1 Tax=Actibacterium sp. MT2.3-13A TaxID=2828332 RepID=UPI001BA9082E|nr:putative glycolipid-binding domain-containing protein [Actibacterium sp. MT2.3-13A]